MIKMIFVSAHLAGNSQLLLGEKSAVLVDCGIPFCADETLANIESALSGRKLDAIMLSHSHYDHIAALPQIKAAYPDTPVCAHPYTATVFNREGALSTMEKMCENAERLFGERFSRRKPMLSQLKADILLNDNDLFPFDDGEMRVLFTPGHTKDCISLDFPRENVTWLCETLGAPRSQGRVQPCYLVGYRSAAKCCEQIAALGRRRYAISHSENIMSEQQSADFLRLAEQVIEQSAELVKSHFEAGDDFDRIFSAYKNAYWSEDYRGTWPFEAFEMNARATIKTVLRELCGQ